MSDFNALVEAEIDRHARQWEKVEERLHAQIDRLHTQVGTLQEELKRLEARRDKAVTWLVTATDPRQPAGVIAERAHLALDALRAAFEVTP